MLRKGRWREDQEVTYRSFREAEDDIISVVERRGSWVRSRSESNLSAPGGGSSLALPQPAVPANTLHKCLRILTGSWRNLFHRLFLVYELIHATETKEYFNLFSIPSDAVRSRLVRFSNLYIVRF
ncbi:hypothetical protein AAG570_012408 [Ranatra chinensis]|uniref:Maturase K n=1 Tax=Ranatra chinensis TaxID=642074 RepID=A0ABD0YV01_9HEMI